MLATSKQLQKPVEIDTCQACFGDGVWKGLHHTGTCDACQGAGFVSAETGQALPYETLVPLLKSMLTYQTMQHDRLLNVPGVRQCAKAEAERRKQEAMYPAGRPAMD